MRFAVPAVLALCSVLGSTAAARAEQSIDLPGGVPTPVPGTALTLLLSDVTDQRCPSDVDCYWMGMIRAEITVLSGTAAETTFVLCNVCDDGTHQTTVAGSTMTLGALRPGREVLDPLGRLIVLQDYTLQITVAP